LRQSPFCKPIRGADSTPIDNQVWGYDFVFDWRANGQRLKYLTVTNEWTKESLAIDVDRRIRSARVVGVLSRFVSKRGAPLYLR
jgi:putative transposase